MATNGTQNPARDSQDDSESGGGLSVNEAATRIEGLLSDEDLGIKAGTSAAKPPKDKSQPKPTTDDEEDLNVDLDEDDDSPRRGQEGVDDDDVDADDEEVAAAADGPDDKDDEVDDEEGAATDLDTSRVVTIKVDGEDVKVPLGEALAGYSRTASFTKKSQKLADERKQHESAVSAKETELRAQAEHYVAQLTALEQALDTPEPNWEKVRQEDPEHFAELHAAWAIHKDRLDTIAAERAREEEKIRATSLKERNALVQNERAKLVEKIPQWGDKSDEAKAFRAKVKEFGITNGFTADELESTTDHRAFVILHKAFLYDQAVAKKKADIAKGKKKVDAIPALPPGAKSGRSKGKKTKAVAAAARLKKSGDVRDAADAIEALLD